VKTAEGKVYGPVFCWQSTITGIYLIIVIALGRLSFPAIEQTFLNAFLAKQFGEQCKNRSQVSSFNPRLKATVIIT